MTTLINILLALVSFTSFFAAFGGKTYLEQEGGWWRGITRRGRVAMACACCTLGLVVTKEWRAYNDAAVVKQEKVDLQASLQAALTNNDSLRTRLTSSLDSMQRMQQRLGEGAVQLIDNTCEGLADAFRLSAAIPRESDDCVAHLQGEERLGLTGRRGAMELYWGDLFEYSMFAPGGVAPPGIMLSVGGRTYPLDKSHGEVRIYGRTPKAMLAELLNPNKLSDVDIKIFVKTTDSNQGQQEFRKLVLQGQCAAFAKRTYKVVRADVARVNSDASAKSTVRSQLTRGSFVRVLQPQDAWTEVMTPEGRQGWVPTEKLGPIE
jgi:hypothetical protein